MRPSPACVYMHINNADALHLSAASSSQALAPGAGFMSAHGTRPQPQAVPQPCSLLKPMPSQRWTHAWYQTTACAAARSPSTAGAGSRQFTQCPGTTLWQHALQLRQHTSSPCCFMQPFSIHPTSPQPDAGPTCLQLLLHLTPKWQCCHITRGEQQQCNLSVCDVRHCSPGRADTTLCTTHRPGGNFVQASATQVSYPITHSSSMCHDGVRISYRQAHNDGLRTCHDEVHRQAGRHMTTPRHQPTFTCQAGMANTNSSDTFNNP